MTRPSVKIVQLGLMRYQEALNLQHMYARKHLDFLAGKTKEQGNLVENCKLFSVTKCQGHAIIQSASRAAWAQFSRGKE